MPVHFRSPAQQAEPRASPGNQRYVGQTAAIATALPFYVIVPMMMCGFVKALKEEDLDPQFDTEASKATG